MTGRAAAKTLSVMSEVELAWVAGLLEGEGSFYVKTDKNARPEIACNMTDKDVLDKLHRIVGAGRMYGPYEYKRPGMKPAWHWRLTTRNDMPELLSLLYPYMGARRQEQILKVLARLKELGYE